MTTRHVVVTIAVAVAIFTAKSAGAQVTCSWTDNPIVTGETPIKAIHINEIRACIDRILGSSPPPPPPPPPGQNITGTWEGTEDTSFLPYTWRFVITDNAGQLSGTYTQTTFASRPSGNVAGMRDSNVVTIRLLDGHYTGDFTGTLAGGVITGEIEYRSSVASLGPYDLTLARVQSSGGFTNDAQFQGRSGEFAELVKQCIGLSRAGGASGSNGELLQCSRSSEQEMLERYGPDWDQP